MELGQRAKAPAAPHTQRAAAPPGTAQGQAATVRRWGETQAQAMAPKKRKEIKKRWTKKYAITDRGKRKVKSRNEE